jgi:hypothetical protein
MITVVYCAYMEYGIQSLLQKDEVNKVVNIVYFMVKRAGSKMRQSGGNHRGSRHWLDEECIESKWKLREALTVFKETNDEVSRIRYWESRKKYERVVVKKKAAWQMEEAEHINVQVRHKDAKKIWEAIMTIVKKWISKMMWNHTTGLNILMACTLGKAIVD